ncbi:MAG: hypothetical protein L0211_22270 [Planctomycetaceae bacterium]|nr:hypothetical protein [Planctomycetaceae bacterium]
MRRKVLAQSQVHPVSKLVAAVEDDGMSGYLYVAKTGKTKRNLEFLWIYNRGKTPTDDEAIAKGANQHWAAWKGCAGPDARCPEPEKSAWTFLWSDDGEAVALAQDGKLVCYLDGEHECFCRHLIDEFQWCMPWEEEAYRRVVDAIRPATAFDRKADRLTPKAIKSGNCHLELEPLPPEADPLRFGRAKREEKRVLADHVKHPIWVSAHDDRHDEEWYKPIVSTTDVSEQVIEFDVPIITVKLAGTDLVGTAYYWAEGDAISDVLLWVDRRWRRLVELPKVKYPAVLVSMPAIRGDDDVRFRVKKRGDDGGGRIRPAAGR